MQRKEPLLSYLSNCLWNVLLSQSSEAGSPPTQGHPGCCRLLQVVPASLLFTPSPPLGKSCTVHFRGLAEGGSPSFFSPGNCLLDLIQHACLSAFITRALRQVCMYTQPHSIEQSFIHFFSNKDIWSPTCLTLCQPSGRSRCKINTWGKCTQRSLLTQCSWADTDVKRQFQYRGGSAERGQGGDANSDSRDSGSAFPGGMCSKLRLTIS